MTDPHLSFLVNPLHPGKHKTKHTWVVTRICCHCASSSRCLVHGQHMGEVVWDAAVCFIQCCQVWIPFSASSLHDLQDSASPNGCPTAEGSAAPSTLVHWNLSAQCSDVPCRKCRIRTELWHPPHSLTKTWRFSSVFFFSAPVRFMHFRICQE